MRNFYSGISNDRTQFLINMNWYKDNEVETCFNLSKNFHGLCEKCSIDKNNFELVYLKFKWVGNTNSGDVKNLTRHVLMRVLDELRE